MQRQECNHSSHISFPAHDLHTYSDNNFCLNCIPCSSRNHPSEVFPSVFALRSQSGDESFLCLECYTDMICTIFEWNYSTLRTEGQESIVEKIKTFNGAIPPEDAKFLLPDIAGSLSESPFPMDGPSEDWGLPDSNDLEILRKLDSIISWNCGPYSESRRLRNTDFLFLRYSESLKDWNNFLNPNRMLRTISEYEQISSKTLAKAEGRMLRLQIL